MTPGNESQFDPAPATPSSLIPAVDAWLDDLTTDAGFADLDAWLAADPANARQLLDLALVHKGLTQISAVPQAPGRSTARPPRPTFRVSPVAYAIAAALLLAAAAVAVYIVAAAPDVQPLPPDASPPVAVLVDADGVVWSSDPFDPGADLRGAPMAIESGDLSLEMRGGAALKVFGPASFRLLGSDRARLDRGSIRARLPHGSGGFTVVTPRGVWARDLGTAFDMTVDDDGAVRVDVTEGRVQVGLPRADEFNTVSTVELSAGQIAVVEIETDAETGADRLTLRRLTVDDPAVIAGHGVERINWPGDSPDPRGLTAVSRPDSTLAAPDPGKFTGVTDNRVIRVTEAVTGSWGSIWLADKASVADGFATRFEFSFDLKPGGSPGDGGDGMSLVIHNHPDGKRLVVGEQGNDAEHSATVDHALAIELDSFANTGYGWEPSSAHVSVRHGDRLLASADLAAGEPRIENLSGSGRHAVEVRYLAGRMSVEFDGRRIFDNVPVDLRSIGAVDADGRAWIGFGARTGGAVEQHNVHTWSLTTAHR